MAVKNRAEIVDAPRAAKKTAEKRKAEAARRFAAQFVEENSTISPRWERAIETYNRVKSETIPD